ncbi:related to CCC2-P-type ATPase involved in export of Cu++ from the cytosol into intracellular, secretory compartments [Rhynchosporium secalis]|uniref:Related to CCC2-P-type ATPase involved in export of Cu++ from the cytosol into intracellular, secretory compartments n=1 Tax=Rhynchosporium secalis TaxID=38038 RepID=A0A1E1M2J3_RHYSE|nr:related to CCC2-P-type ATPase involved in export of Cu++ from the cytosol into intracellular, secretory compartments [Rhynchosporium secalis]
MVSPSSISEKVSYMTAKPNMVTTSFILSNLHCPSCVSHIQNTLYALDPAPITVSPSLISSAVTIEHDTSLPASYLQVALESAGFEIFDVAPNDVPSARGTGLGLDGSDGCLDRVADKLSSDQYSWRRAKAGTSSQHMRHCMACQRATARTVLDTKLSWSAKNTSKMQSSRGLQLVTVDSAGTQPSLEIWRASIAIGGMTCAACVASITKELEKKDWIRKVVVNLIANSAIVDFVGEEHKDDIVKFIQDIGFEATIDNVVDINKVNSGTLSAHRTVEVNLDGMFCDHCPPRLHAALSAAFGSKVKIDRHASLQKPILQITYTPQIPNFTIRDIIATIKAVDEAIIPSIYHPPTLEERSRQLHSREQLRILIRVFLALIIAVPTLIIGIIYMSLVSRQNLGKQFLMHPLYAGVSRTQWSLFIMATPVYFLCADVFHIRALKEIRSMWRPGSSTPIFQRFYRFGSMNMLMSLGTSVAYISSVVQLIVAGINKPKHVDESGFYFDSVVFLTLFLLVGRLIESYSKSKTGDAIAMLGKLRPTEALLVEDPSVSRRSSGDTLIEDLPTGEQLAMGSQPESIKHVIVDLLEHGDVVRILHGGSPPCDGIIVQGGSKFDESSLTGESRLVKKNIGDEVFSGTVNKDSPVSIRITGVAGKSMLDQIVQAVREGQTKRAPMERVADRLTAYFVPVITFIAIMTWLVWLGLGVSGTLPQSYLGHDQGGWVAWSLQFAIAVFVVACPCGLALAAPTALFVGGGLAAKYGILVKGGGEAFEKASELDCIVFDKTGTLTVGGEPIVTDFEISPIIFAKGYKMSEEESEILRQAKAFEEVKESTREESQSRILGMVMALEADSSHTVAKALVSFCNTMRLTEPSVDKVEEIAGRGMKGTFNFDGPVSGSRIEMIIGNEAFLTNNKIVLRGSTQSTLEKWKLEGKSVALVAVMSHYGAVKTSNGTWQLAAMFAISDPIRPEAPGIIEALQKGGRDVWMLSGDNQMTANAIGTKVGIPLSNIIAGVLPGEKADRIRYLQTSLKKRTVSGKDHHEKRALVAMVGDGINDSPALSTADVGIAIGSGSDIAISSAGFVLVSSNLNSLITLLDLSSFVFRRIKFNFGWALIYNLVALPVAAGVFYPICSGGKHIRLDPVWASLAMALSSISVVCSSLLLRSRLPWVGFKVRKAVGGEE